MNQIELRVECRNLINKDVLSKSDPQVYLFSKVKNEWMFFAKSEVIDDCLNPNFVYPFKLTFHFERMQELRFVVVDVDNTGPMEEQDMIGTFETLLGNVMTAKGQRIQGKLMHKSVEQGIIFVCGEEISGGNDRLDLCVEAYGLEKKNWLFGSDPFYEILRSREDNTWNSVYKSPAVRNTTKPNWGKASLDMGDICNGDRHRSIRILLHSYKSYGAHVLIGELQTTVEEMTRLPSFAIVNPRKKNREGYKNSGTLKVKICSIIEEPTFLSYLSFNQTEINLIVAIDFTASNGQPHDPKSLHYRSSKQNPYEIAISQVGQVLEHYDSDKLIPVYGFGARLPSGQVTHCWPLNGNYDRPHVAGVGGILESYHLALNNVSLYGPTNFAPVVHSTMTMAKEFQGKASHYFILLIITDGVITDFDSTKRAIIEASALPLSIVIVGVGNENFMSMHALDSDEKLLSEGGNTAKRDIVQFVPLVSTADVASATLAEIPTQVVEYMKLYNISSK